MAKHKTKIVYRFKTPEDIKSSIDNILDQLEKHGSAITPNGKASRILSRYIDSEVKNKRIYFTWNSKHKLSFIVLPHHVKIKRTGPCKIKFEYEPYQTFKRIH